MACSNYSVIFSCFIHVRINSNDNTHYLSLIEAPFSVPSSITCIREEQSAMGRSHSLVDGIRKVTRVT